MKINPFEETYQLIQMDGYNCLFTNLRLDRSLLPKGIHCYDVRDSDDLDGSFAEVQPFVLVNHWGTIICKDKIPLDKDGSYYPKDEEVFLDKSISLASFLELSRVESDELFDDGTWIEDPIKEKDLARKYIQGYEYGSSFGDITVFPEFYLYRDNNLYLGLEYYDEEEGRTDFFGSVTVNTDAMPYLHNTIDTEKNGTKILEFLEQNGFGQRTGRSVPSGNCWYPQFCFNEEIVAKHAPDILNDYKKTVDKPNKTQKAGPLSGKICDAKERASNTSPADHFDRPVR